jgi:hypothetical protein
MTVFGPDWDVLRLEDLAAFLQDAPSEPLVWEAKGDASRGSVRKQVCGFANGYDTGYLILGVQQGSDGAWTLDGVAFPNGDPPNAITDMLANGGVTPYPDGLEVNPFDVGDGKHVAVVRIPPVATPPCNTAGIVYERVSGKTIPVTDPMRLSALFGRGDAARRDAELKAERAALSVRDRAPAERDAVQIAIGLAAAGYAPDIGSRLFSRRFETGLQASIQRVLAGDLLIGPAGPRIDRRVTQEAIMLRSPAEHRLGWSWTVRGSWDGAIGLHWTVNVPRTSIDVIVDQVLEAALASGDEVLDILAPSGPRYLYVIVMLGETPLVYSGFPDTEPVPEQLFVQRGPLEPGGRGDVLASIKRELERATGLMAYEG